MKKLSVLVVLALVLTAFAPFISEAKAEETITVFNWYDYIDDTVIEQFEEETGIKVKYANFTTVEEMYVKMTAGGGNYDVVIPSDYMIERMIKEGMLLELDYDLLPNAEGLIEWMKDPAYDSEGAHSVPYMWGTVGILYNTKYVDEADVTGWELLWNEKYAGKILTFGNSRDAFGIAQFMLGYDINTTDKAQLDHCAQLLKQQKQKTILRPVLQMQPRRPRNPLPGLMN